MPGRIIEMTLGVEDQVTAVETIFGNKLRMRVTGNSLFENRSELYDAQVVTAAGFEMPKFDVQGGGLYSGGSHFSGIRANDRELTVTMKPTSRLSPSDLKQQIGQMISMTSMNPLSLRVKYETGGTARVYQSNVYVSEVTSPILERDTSVQIVMKMGSPSFTGDTVLVSEEGTVKSEKPVVGQEIRVSDGDTHRYLRHLYLSDDTLLTTNAPFKVEGQFWVRIPHEQLTNLAGLTISNMRGDSIEFNPPEDILSTFVAIFGAQQQYYDFGVNFNSYTRSISYVHELNRRTITSPQGPLIMKTNNRWPMGLPAKQALTFGAVMRNGNLGQVLLPRFNFSFSTERYGF